MRVVLASKCYLGVAILSAAAVCGGCQSNDVAPRATTQAAVVAPGVAPESMATASPSTITAPAAVGDTPTEVSQTDVINWAVRGVSDDVIVDRIDHARSTFHLSAGDELRLRDAGVSDEVVRAMRATIWN